MKKRKDIFAYFHKELVEKWYKHWIVSIKNKLPKDLDISVGEIDSEITAQCQYLAKKFKFGSYCAYCNEYVVKLVVRNLMNEYNMLKHSSLDALEEYENGYAYEERHHYGVGEANPLVVTNDSNIEHRLDGKYETQRWTALYEAAFTLDKDTDYVFKFAEIVDMLKMKMAMAQISVELNTYKMDVRRRISILVDKAKEKINGKVEDDEA